MESQPRKRKMHDMMIEGQGRKEDKHQHHHLKAGQVEDEVEDQCEDDEKMEKFFELIRSTRDMRDRMNRRSLASLYHEVPTTSSSSSSRDRNRIQADHQEKVEEMRGSSAAMTWNPPSFQPEDFLEGSHHLQSGPNSKTEEDHDDNQGKMKGKDEGGCGALDLNLSL